MSNTKEIARLANVSTATVSRYFNAPDTVSKKTRKKLEEVIRKENYYPNGLISSFFKNKTNTIGVIIHDLMNPFFPVFASEITVFSNKYEYQVYFCNAKYSEKEEKKHLNKLMEQRVEGLIVLNTTNPRLYENITIPIISVERSIPNTSFVESDNYRGGVLVSEFLSKCNNILILDGPDHLDAVGIRREALLSNYKKQYSIINFTRYDVSLLEKFDLSKFDGIYAYNDLAVYKYLQYTENRYEQKVIGFDNLHINEFVNYSFSTINQNVTLLAQKTVEKLYEQITDPKPPENYKIAVELVKIN